MGAPKSVLAAAFIIVFQLIASGQSQRKDAPYCATRESETKQTLGDGTHIILRSKNKVCRDSLGRIRNESFESKSNGQVSEEPTVITINDPIEHVFYRLDIKRRLATRTVQNPLPAASRSQAPVLPPSPVKAPAFQSRTLEESLGTQQIEGLLVQGHRGTITHPIGEFGNDKPMVMVDEQWVSSELGEVILLKRTDPRYGDSVIRLTDVN